MDSSKGQRSITQRDYKTKIQNNQEAWEEPQVNKQAFFVRELKSGCLYSTTVEHFSIL